MILIIGKLRIKIINIYSLIACYKSGKFRVARLGGLMKPIKNNIMTLANFIKENRQELDSCIKNVVPGASLNDSERRLWILNDEGLYNWARSSGVKI